MSYYAQFVGDLNSQLRQMSSGLLENPFLAKLLFIRLARNLCVCVIGK